MLMFCGSRSAAGSPVPPSFPVFSFLGGVGVCGWWRAVVCRMCRDCVCLIVVFVCVRCYERSVDALALGADEGRGGLRYSSGSRLAGCDPRVSEWGDPAPVVGRHPCLKFIGRGG